VLCPGAGEGSNQLGNIEKKSRPEGCNAFRPALCVSGFMSYMKGIRHIQAVLITLVLVLLPVSAKAVPAGTPITNSARADFNLNSTSISSFSNTVTILTVSTDTPSTVEFARYAPSSPDFMVTVLATEYFSTTAGTFVTAPAPVPPGGGPPITLGVPLPLALTNTFAQTDPVFIRLTDGDENTDPLTVQTVTVTLTVNMSSETETLRLTETAPNSGVFTGYIQTGPRPDVLFDGTFNADVGAGVVVDYTDPTDITDSSSDSASISPSGVLYMTKSADKGTVSAGDFIPYRITLENTTGSTAPGVVVTDTLPAGFRYGSGSLSIDGVGSPDPAISSDGGTITISIGDLLPGASVQVKYVLKVSVGTRTGRALNSARATAGVLVSNTASVAVQVVEDIFRSRNILMGRIIAGGCGEPGGSSVGLAGIRIFLEDGTFVLTDEYGRYHFEGVRSGTHVVQMDTDTLPMQYQTVACGEDSRSAGSSFSKFVELQGGTLWRVNFNVALRPREKGKAVLELRSTIEGGDIRFMARLMGERVPIKNLRMTVQLPDGVRYKKGSSRIDGRSIDDPSVSGSYLLWRLGDMSAGWDSGLRFDTEPVETWKWLEKKEPISLSTGEGKHKAKAVSGRMAEVLSRAVITFDTPGAGNSSSLPIENVLLKVSEESRIRAPKFVLHPHFQTFEARLQKEDEESLDNLAASVDPSKVVRIYVVGHTDSLPIAEGSRHIYSDNYALSLARARSVAAYLSRATNLPPYMFAYYGRGPDVPVADNDTPEGMAKNRRVEVRVVTEDIVRRTSVEPFHARSRTEVVTVGLRPGEKLKQNDNPNEPEAGTVDLLKDLSWLEKENRDLEWILPEKGYMPPIPSLKVVVKHNPDSKLALLINGERVSPLNFEGSVTNGSDTAALSLWRGVDLADGDNRFDLVELDADGAEIARIRRTFHYSGPPVDVELVPALSKPVANGKQAPVVAVRLTDKAGYPARMGIIGRFSVDPPYLPHDESVWDDSLNSQEKKRYRFSVGDDGVALLKLKPTSRSGEAVLHIGLADRSEEVKVWLQSEPREWILVGLAEGTAGFNAVSGNMTGLDNAGVEDSFYTDGKVAFFAKGRIKGKWLMTLSYDISKTKDATGDSLHQTIDPDTYYTLYGDSAEQDYEAASSQKLYLKIEHSQFYALFGDYDTGLTVTELSRYNRSFTGLKSELKSEKFGYKIFAARTDQSFVRDEIRGDGTSGLYRLSNSNIVINSEKVKIEIRDRFRSELIISTRDLARHTDYNIDYQAGTLFFKEPVSDRDGSFNPVFVVVEYESVDSRGQKTTFGGRGTVRLSGDKAELGVSLIHEGNTGSEGDLAGIDATVELGEGTQLRAEIAATSSKTGVIGKDGSAYLAEITHSGSKVKGTVYLREQDEDFGLGQQSASETGTRKLGVDVSYRATDTVTVSGQGFRQLNYATGGEREVVEAKVAYAKSNYSVSGGLRQATDTVAASKDTSTQLNVGGEYLTMANRLKLRLEHDQSLGSNDNTDYPTRTILGSDYKLSNAISLFAQQEYTQGKAGDTIGTRMGMKADPWEGGHATSSIEQASYENSSRVFANLGLTQTFRVSERWRISGALEQSRIFGETTSLPFNSNVPASSGGEDFTSVSFGTSFSHSIWQWNARLETRESDSEDKVGFLTDLIGEPEVGIGIFASGTFYLTDIVAGGSRTDRGIRLGLVYRPLDSDWILLDKLDYLVQKEEGSGVSIDSWKVVNNLNANYQSSPRNQIAFQCGLKYSTEDIDGNPYRDFAGLFGVEDRYDLTQSWDMGLRTSVLHSWESGTVDYSAGISVGYSLMENAWLSFGYNFLGFVDGDFSGADFSAQGPYIRLRLKFDQKSIKDLFK